ncbi:GHKL domain-containing protein [Diplocloster agilis]|uniref:GHKL domain-containing protein n=1 Tax=Diplocloster agilis TaxID=2850323 RepID=UPI0008221609|nr:GHKL domain-containing protein [Suonthocola fibrivorans]MCU6735997.1 GHKL domain-containing protein [Suonthocola fibrivorans]SCJ85023.1 sensory histidine kinase DcuS [uncultured Clostridium sp.]
MIFLFITNFIYTFIRIFIGFLLLKDLFESKFENKKFFRNILLATLPITLVTAINMLLYFYSNNELIIECVYATIIGTILFIGKKRVIFVVNVFYQISFVMINLFIMYLINIFSSEEGYLFINIASKGRYFFTFLNLIVLVIYYFFIHKFIKDNIIKIENYYKVLATASLAIFLVTAYYQDIYINSITNIVFYQWLLWFIAFIVLMTTFLIYFKYRKINENVNMAIMRNSLLESSYTDMHSIFQDNAMLCHDINKHFMILNKLLETGKFDDARQYLSNLHYLTKKVANFIWTDNEFVDMILNSKLLEAEKLGINININVDKITFSDNNYDLCLILGNLLDNAIEASSQVNDNKWICITILKNNNIMNINISNNYSISPVEKNGKLYTTKLDKRSHGLGLDSVKQLVEKNEGVFNYKYENNIFEANVTLFNFS